MSADFIVQNEDSLSDRIVRAPLTDADQALGFTGGVITFLDLSLINLNKTRVQAVDFQVDYALETDEAGSFNFYLVGSRQTQRESQILVGGTEIDTVGFSNGPLAWRANFGVDWEKGPLRAGWNAQYYDSYFVHPANSSDAVEEGLSLRQGSGKISSQLYHDLYLRYALYESFDIANGALSNADLFVGIRNVFNESPPILATTGLGGAGYSTYGDPRLRTYSVSLRKRF